MSWIIQITRLPPMKKSQIVQIRKPLIAALKHLLIDHGVGIDNLGEV